MASKGTAEIVPHLSMAIVISGIKIARTEISKIRGGIHERRPASSTVATPAVQIKIYPDNTIQGCKFIDACNKNNS